ncbi:MULTISPECIES: FliA/WhiG family RNA polymerase sigma factor [Pseudoalteromonas]|jgi:RNA polymerase sigma factor for flagellar operon FliA|uniref:RNA polymerase sigma factor for flagellar operon FliA n=1 Tax=Pseudoalteromonas aliena SW19 TaxID=1314866 RepID=A0ABR9DZU2_9GAMM|nr:MULTISPECIES: FliA/WhiG family RNA polymerase sigma factor [Pseudoalteromonas]MBE0359883.1 RNA polymerase sigma factor for flagellar operon FliA [Pseudoalteromonas aliena SW19]TMO01647.1 FliA/WhiG family RNA polymerase sigma factor [Pseudoalteromonas sp. S558]
MLLNEEWGELTSEPLVTLSPAKETELLTQYSFLVKRAAAHMRTQVGVLVDNDDIQQIGLVALLSSLRRYGRDIDEKFTAFAFKRIRGAMLDEFRRLDWRPRQLRQQSHQLRDMTRTLRKQHGREATDTELCDALNIEHNELIKLQYSEQAEAIESLESLLEDNPKLSITSPSSEDKADTVLMLKKAMSGMNTREKLLLQLYYTHEMNMKEIALTLELTEARVCQLHKRALETLTKKLQQI